MTPSSAVAEPVTLERSFPRRGLPEWGLPEWGLSPWDLSAPDSVGAGTPGCRDVERGDPDPGLTNDTARLGRAG